MHVLPLSQFKSWKAVGSKMCSEYWAFKQSTTTKDQQACSTNVWLWNIQIPLFCQHNLLLQPPRLFFFANHSLDFLNGAGLYLDLIFYKVRKKNAATFKIHFKSSCIVVVTKVHFCCIFFSIFRSSLLSTSWPKLRWWQKNVDHFQSCVNQAFALWCLCEPWPIFLFWKLISFLPSADIVET